MHRLNQIIRLRDLSIYNSHGKVEFFAQAFDGLLIEISSKIGLTNRTAGFYK